MKFRRSKRSIYYNNNIQQNEKEIELLSVLVDNANLSFIQENILYYIAGTIVRLLLSEIHCCYCIDTLIDKNVIHNKLHTYAINMNKYNSFTTFVNRGKLCYPSNTIFEIIKTTEKVFKIEITLGNIQQPNFTQKIVNSVIQKLLPKIKEMFSPKHPIVDSTGSEDLHEIQMIKIISSKYIKLRTLTYCKKMTERHLKDKGTSRAKLHKTILFYHV